MTKTRRTVSRIYLALIFLFLYAPIVVLIIFSFNDTKTMSRSVWSGFTFRWYVRLWEDSLIQEAVWNTVIIAVVAALFSTLFGTVAAVGISHMRGWRKKVVMNLTNFPMVNPEIVTGVSMMLLFVASIRIAGIGQLGFVTMLIAHTTFNLPYVILSVLPKFQTLDRTLCEAAMDLGCTPVRTFFRIEVPAVMPGIVSGLILGFTLSLDDFVISHFVSSPDFMTLPLYIYNQTAHDVKFSMYALCTIIIIVILALLMIINFIGPNRKKKKAVAK